jgi:cytochrome P450
MSLLLAVILHPDTQKRAQEELDAATGRERLPTYEDRPRLPFVDAMCKEVMRWRPVTPVGVSIQLPVSRAACLKSMSP